MESLKKITTACWQVSMAFVLYVAIISVTVVSAWTITIEAAKSVGYFAAAVITALEFSLARLSG